MTTLTERIDENLLSRCPRLKAVCNIAVGYNNIDLAACSAHGVMATNTPGVLDDTTADFAWALILATARRLNEAEAYVREGRWDKWKLKQFLGLDVHHATLGIIGLGRIGQAVARRAAGFEMEVLYHDVQRAAPAIESACRARYVPKEELYPQGGHRHDPYPLQPGDPPCRRRPGDRPHEEIGDPHPCRPGRGRGRCGPGRGAPQGGHRRRRSRCLRGGARHPSRVSRN